MQIRSILAGAGGYLPERIVTNDELAKRLDTSDEWIVQRTGIHQRHIVEPGVATQLLPVPVVNPWPVVDMPETPASLSSAPASHAASAAARNCSLVAFV